MENSISHEIRNRILYAADQLYTQDGNQQVPTVDAVRRVAKVNMHDASAVMKEWRLAHRNKAATHAIVVPDEVHKVGVEAMEQLWRVATNYADRARALAQAGWELERAEHEANCLELATAFDSQMYNAKTLQARLEASEQALRTLETRYQAAQRKRDEFERALAESKTRHVAAEARAAELEKRTLDLKEQLVLCHSAQKRLHDDLVQLRRPDD